MKRNIFILFLFLFIPWAVMAQEVDSVYMGTNYENDVYYSLETGMMGMETAAEWDIAFSTGAFSSGILINDGNGALLKTYPNGDTADWSTLDTAGYSQWPEMYNHENDWAVSAFERHALGHPDYGWGVYDMTTHNVTGDSLYVLKLTDGSFKKVWIEQKVSTQNTYYFRYADLDGENEQQAEFEVNPYTSKNFVYYSLTNDDQIDREPLKDSWDLLFTRYISMINGETPYIVTGVLNNLNTPVAEYASVDPDFMDYQPADFDTAKSVIGYDWKEFDMGSFTYTVDDSLVYFVESHNGAVYKLRFTKFEGSSTGKVVFEKSLISTTDVEEFVAQESPFKAFPNPATDRLTIQSPYDGEVQFILHDITGRVAESGHFSGREFRLDVSGQERGVYLLQLRYDNHSVTNKIAIK